MHREIGARHGQALGHAQDRRDTDTTGQQQAAAGIVCQSEVVLGGADLQQLALVHRLRAAARSRIAQHANQVAVVFLRVVAQRVLARKTTRQVHVHVRAGGKTRQGRTRLCGDQFQGADVGGFDGFARHANRQG